MADDEEGTDDDHLSIVSVFGGNRRGGRWRVPESTSITALFGRAFLDLREAECSAKQISVTCMSVFAGVTILVPEGADVRPAGTAILASSSCHIPMTDTRSLLPPILVSSTTILGKLRVQTIEVPPKAKRSAQKQQRRTTPVRVTTTVEAAD